MKKLKPTFDDKTKQMEILKKQYTKDFLNFPSNSGISGQVFSAELGKIYHSNSADKETNFVVDIDNQSTTTEIKNFMIGQVIGKDGKPNAVIQLINKLDATGHIAEITPEALKRFQDM